MEQKRLSTEKSSAKEGVANHTPKSWTRNPTWCVSNQSWRFAAAEFEFSMASAAARNPFRSHGLHSFVETT